MRDVVVALDSGTTSSRAIVFDRRGRVLGSVSLEHRQYFPQPGWVEHDAAEIRDNAIQVLNRVVTECGLDATDVAAVGITNQRETAVVWNRHTGAPIAPAIVWQDTRTQGRVDALMSDGGVQRFADRTGLPLATYFSATKFAEIIDSVPGARTAADAGSFLPEPSTRGWSGT